MLGRGRLLTICIPVFAAGLAVPALWPSALATGAAFAAMGAVSCLDNVTTVAFRQRVIRASRLSRVTVSYRLLSFGPCRSAPRSAGSSPASWAFARCSP
jgi:hypothetical protein